MSHRTPPHRAVAPVVSVVALCLIALPGQARAQSEDEDLPIGGSRESKRKTLAERIPAVTQRSFQKEGRVEVTPQVGLSLNDPFFRHVTLGGGLAFHIAESLAVAATGEFYLGIETPVRVSGGGNPPKPDYNRPQYAARLDLIWAPLYGKLSLLAERILHFDTYVLAGVGVVGPNKTSPTVAASVAIGQHYVMNEWMAVKVELRDQIFKLARNPVVSKEKDLQNLLTATVGLCFYLPTEVERPTL